MSSRVRFLAVLRFINFRIFLTPGSGLPINFTPGCWFSFNRYQRPALVSQKSAKTRFYWRMGGCCGLCLLLIVPANSAPFSKTFLCPIHTALSVGSFKENVGVCWDDAAKVSQVSRRIWVGWGTLVHNHHRDAESNLQWYRKWNLVLRTWGQKLFNGEKKDFWMKKGTKKGPFQQFGP